LSREEEKEVGGIAVEDTSIIMKKKHAVTKCGMQEIDPRLLGSTKAIGGGWRWREDNIMIEGTIVLVRHQHHPS
jgi:hypothetical protein